MNSKRKTRGVRARRRTLLSLFLALVTIAALGPSIASAGWQATLKTTLVSIASDGTHGDNSSQDPSLSFNGETIAFESNASNLVPSDTNGYEDVFVHDKVSNETTRVSVATDGTQGNRQSRDPSIDYNGERVAFESYANNLHPGGDTNSDYDVFVRDLKSGETTLCSISTAGDTGNNDSYDPAISGDGRYVAFESKATDLIPSDTNGSTYDIFVRDLESHTTTIASVSSDGTQGSSSSYDCAISSDGRYVAFESYASNLVPGDTNGQKDVFVRDIQSGETTRVSVATDGTQGDSSSENPAVSGDGRYVAFESNASNLVPDDANGDKDIFVHDMQTGKTWRVSVTSDGMEGDGSSYDPAMDSDGTYVAFESNAELVDDDTGWNRDIYVHEIATGETFRASYTDRGAEPEDGCDNPSLAHGALLVGFDTSSDNMVAGDTNDADDVFVRQLALSLTPGSSRIAGSDRYGTAVKASQELFPDGAEDVVIATGANWPDALGGSALAGALGAPILLTRSDALPANVKTEIERLGAENAYIVGGPGVVSFGVEDELEAMLDGTVNRLAGADRYETSEITVRFTTRILDERWGGTVLVATGASYADALAGAPLASGLDWPIVLASPTTGEVTLPDGTVQAVILGGTGAVPASVETVLRNTKLANEDVVRVSGATRYDTAAAVAQYGVDEGLLWNGVGLATGQAFPDGLAGGAAMGMQRTVLLLTPTSSLASAAEAKLKANKDDIESVRFLGGTGAVSSGVEAKVDSILGF